MLASTASAVRAADSACQYLTRTISRQPGAALLLASDPAAISVPLRQVAFVYDNAATAAIWRWAMLALLTLDGPSHPRRADQAAPLHPQGALRIAQWLEAAGFGAGRAAFTGGSFGSESAPQRLLWKWTEHNVDLAAAFTRLAAASADPHWQGPARVGAGAAVYLAILSLALPRIAAAPGGCA